jgi:transcriptional regulator with XRE-family HTH domain
VSGKQTETPFAVELPRLLAERPLSLRAFARQIDVSNSHLSRVVRGVDYKRPSADLVRKVALALGLPPDYFPEFRESFVLERIRSDSKLRNKLYAEMTRHGSLDQE